MTCGAGLPTCGSHGHQIHMPLLAQHKQLWLCANQYLAIGHLLLCEALEKNTNRYLFAQSYVCLSPAVYLTQVQALYGTEQM